MTSWTKPNDQPPGSGNRGWYYRLSSFFRHKFGAPVYKIPLHAGFSCPNRDGTIGRGGCTYCYNPSFSPFSAAEVPPTIDEQIRRGKKKKKMARYLAYFQAYTNTYAPVPELKKAYDLALADPEVIGLSVATRPDCVSEEIIDLLANYARHKHVWIEYGLQSSHNQTLKTINRGHDKAAFTAAVELSRDRGIYLCAHIILSLPGETKPMMLETIDYLNSLKLDGIKFHHLQVIVNTPLAAQYREGLVEVYEEPSAYISILCDCLEHLSPQTVVHRLAGQAITEKLLIAPHWKESSGQIAALTEAELINRQTYQGKKCQGDAPFYRF